MSLLAAASLASSASAPPAQSSSGTKSAAKTTTKSGAPSARGSSVVATVGSLSITRGDVDRRSSITFEEYQRRTGMAPPADLVASLRRQSLEGLIRANLLMLEAERLKIPVTDAEAEALVKKDPVFNPNGTFSAKAYENAKLNSPQAYQQAMLRARREIAARKLNDQLTRQKLPQEDQLRRSAERALTKTELDQLVLRTVEFSGVTPEPREVDVVRYYHDHLAEFRHPDRAVLSVIDVDARGAQPTNDPALRARADSALTAIRGGATFDEVGDGMGTLRRGIVVLTGNFPGDWRGDERTNHSIFQQPPGTVLPDPMPTTAGWRVVRVDERSPAALSPLKEVAPTIRARLRDELRQHDEERHVRAMYDASRDSISRPAVKVRYVAIDTSRVNAGEPSDADLDVYYRSHQADYTTYDAGSGGLKVQSLAEVRPDVKRRWSRERRLLTARLLAERIEGSWRSGKRDAKAESDAGGAKDVGPIAIGAPVDPSIAGRVLGDTLSRHGSDREPNVVSYPLGAIVYQVLDRVERFTPPYEQAKPSLEARWRQQQRDHEEQAARAAWERDPKAFATTNNIYFTRLLCPPPQPIDIALTRPDVERWYREHFDDYSSPEEVRARHILISPANASPDADRAARARADDLLRRIRAGEDFVTLAKRYSDDPATQQDGGDLGYFTRGVMLDEVEHAAFTLGIGEVSDVVKSSAGYHIIRVLDHLPLYAEPLKHLYVNVGYDAATDKGDRIARHLADSLFQGVRTPAQARAAGKKLGLETESSRHMIGDRAYAPSDLPTMIQLEKVVPGQLFPGIVASKGRGWTILWVDSIAAPSLKTWDRASSIVVPKYMAAASERAVAAKRAEMDSLSASGWSLDSLAAPWGGLVHRDDYRRGSGIEGLGSPEVVDSLVLGGAHTPALARGTETGWLQLPRGSARLRIGDRTPPSPAQLEQRIATERRVVLEYKLIDDFKDMRARYPVKIVDPVLRDTPLPTLPPPPEL